MILDKAPRLQTSYFGRTMISYDDDVDAAMQVHLLQTVHQLTDDVINLPQRVIQL